MPTSIDFVEFVCEQIRGTGDIRYRKMFGEYMIYINEKPIILLCDNTVYVKKCDELAEELADADTGIPYDGAKERYILDIENTPLTHTVISILDRITPTPKPKKKPSKK